MIVEGLTFEKAMLELISSGAIPDADPSLDGKIGSLTLLLSSPRGFCAGVRRAIDAVRDALKKHGPPVYVRRPIVHNLEVVRTLEAEGAIFVQELDEVPRGSVVLFSAHGVSPAIRADAVERGLISYDAVCPLVAKVHREVERHEHAGRTVILVGHRGHPEIDGTLGHLQTGAAFVVRTAEEVNALEVAADAPAAYAIQTTYSTDEASDVVDALRSRFIDLAEPPSSDICYATTNRQAAVKTIARRSDHVMIVGEQFSSNACRLVEAARAHLPSVQLVAGREDIDWNQLPEHGVVGIGAAASTPESSVQEIVSALGRRYLLAIENVESARESAVFRPMELM